MDVRIEMLDPIHVTRVRHVSAYEEIGSCFDRLFRWADGIGVPSDRVVTRSRVNPEAVAPETLRWDACVELRKAEEPPSGIVLGPVGGGRHAVYWLIGPYDGITGAYNRLLEAWLPSSGESMGEGPCMEEEPASGETTRKKAYIELCGKTIADRSLEDVGPDLCVPLRVWQLSQ